MLASWRTSCFLLMATLTEAQLRILAPKAVARQFAETHGMVYGTTATFGAPYYGDRVLGLLVYGKSKGNAHCDDSDYELPSRASPALDSNGENAGQELVNVVLVRRGICTFVKKVSVAQEKGAHAVIVVDTESSELSTEEVQHIVMSAPADGSADMVRIPSMLISKMDGQKLIDAASQESLVVELAWDIPRGKVVMTDFWMSSGSREAAKFLHDFKDCADALKDDLQFVPHYHIFSLSEDGADSESTGHLCLDGGSELCAPDPDGPGPITGEDVANEDARQLCILNTTAKKRDATSAVYSQPFWHYVDRFHRHCKLEASDVSRRFGDQCSWSTMAAVGIDADAVKDCMQRHRIPMLREQLKNVAWSPQALRINGWRYSGPLDPETVLKAVCAGYSTQPAACHELLKNNPAIFKRAIRGITSSALIVGLALLVLALYVVFYSYRRHVTSSVRKVLREEVMLEVQSQMADYVPMEDANQDHRPEQRILSF
eukprot:TRINITY_DN42558_c0_g1_i1.p1 TRINITY_DN42558_c0_g1~~TRINITY_DN42558_c0_g1_i1.p1  ORF type:complete len:488 (+),score=99.71 TRINITY_DN42558_c0_g1_i1:23-1486(+)